jgi:hypothetical protein
MTDEWFNNLYEKAGADLYEANINRLAFEFRYLGSRLEETKLSQTETSYPAAGNEASRPD